MIRTVRKRIFIFGIILALVIMAVVGVILATTFSREGVTVTSGTFSNWSAEVGDDYWSVSARRANGSARIDLTLTAAELANLRVGGTAAGGDVRLVIIQGDYQHSLYITYPVGTADQSRINRNIDMSNFEPDRIRLRLEFDRVENVDMAVLWCST